MKGAPPPSRWATPLALAWILAPLALGAQLAVQEIALGYVANVPELMLGATLHATTGSGFGAFVDLKVDIDSPENEPNFLGDQTADQVAASTEHDFFQSEDGWFSLSAGLTRRIVAGRLMGYAGAGFARRTRYNEYFDPDRELGRAGFYWVEDPDRSGGELNLLGGLIFALSPRARVRMGVESTPGGMTLGGLLALPVG